MLYTCKLGEMVDKTNLNLVPVTLSHSLVFEICNEGHRPLKCIYLALAHLHYLPVSLL